MAVRGGHRKNETCSTRIHSLVLKFGNDTKSSRGRRNAGRAEHNGGIARFQC